ncbi:hypothetical protein RHSIM_RhsimUnG0071600 [Rhododendron simsii]|uniref:Uncharacterized protein n=1 Tax=Rhododendron simsii TaxID=118357 RepID=A0A834FVD5_RHOSS|nr:hypothetical protein RHSIM_RhsimUnG0071600 [Rhododendron simsii]
MLKRLEKKLHKGALMEAAQACKNTEQLAENMATMQSQLNFLMQLQNGRNMPSNDASEYLFLAFSIIRKREWTLATIAFLLDPVDPLFCKALFPAGSLANSPRDKYDQMLAADCSTIDGDHLVDEDTV